MKSKIYNALKGVIFKDKTKDDYTNELVNIADEFALDFAEWYLNLWLTDNKSHFDNCSPKQLLEIYKNQKSTI